MKKLPVSPYAHSDFMMLAGRHQETLKVIYTVDVHGYIGGFGRFGGKPGNGAKAMRHICWMADKWGQDLNLRADNERLCEFYAQFGFVKRDTKSLWMDRLPNKGVTLSLGEWRSYDRWVSPHKDRFMEAKQRHYAEHREAAS